ncbi:unnamed protein product (macronuclear) [Paramecium tetraurelia]|uniref:Uncharacterized protein n=1 Tax=Paramecium tetraurelia TaxID=5888 RepID=A0DN52_PARTE|nr:uncharacterized protein GSPATT00018674001 [Paramecium tetraurelia]CAK84469.1 unnamed protein product [Paramecium tetraurelia]|eukprot:XP_001451866.1 hypothetical protein (macronuclear) [Paramecium tetraurelia strain d4-2]
MGNSCCEAQQSEKEILQGIKSNYIRSQTSIASKVLFSKPQQEVKYENHILLNIDEEPVEELKEDFHERKLYPVAKNLNKKFLHMLE